MQTFPKSGSMLTIEQGRRNVSKPPRRRRLVVLADKRCRCFQRLLARFPSKIGKHKKSKRHPFPFRSPPPPKRGLRKKAEEEGGREEKETRKKTRQTAKKFQTRQRQDGVETAGLWRENTHSSFSLAHPILRTSKPQIIEFPKKKRRSRK